MRIGLDVMGGDFAPVATIEGAVKALDKIAALDKIILIGPRSLILSELSKHQANPDIFEIVDAPEIIEMEEKPVQAIQSKPDASMCIGMKMLKNKELDIFASAGNSGALMVAAMQYIGLSKGIIRPCVAAEIPKEPGGYSLLLDIGTNPDAKPEVLYQYGILGKVYTEAVFNTSNPRVALLNIGHEDGKGNIQCQSAFSIMKNSIDFNFIGNLETRDLYRDSADVFVCDGFVGNIVTKQIEATYRLLYKRNNLDSYFSLFNYEISGGSPILGIAAPVILGHGISSATAIQNMILLGKRMFENQLTQKIETAFANSATKS